jgi:micrococcal nuclease
MKKARLYLPLLFVSGLVLALPSPASAATCADHPNQASAQRAKDTRDADGDGIYCETNPCPCSTGAGSGPSEAERKAKARARARARAKARARARARARKRAAARRARQLRNRYEDEDAQVVEVIDGDTVKVRITSGYHDGKLVTVRLIGIDTPETRKPGVGVECGGQEATAHMQSIAFTQDATGAFVGEFVVIDTDESQDLKDSFGRLLAYLDTNDGQDLAWAQVAMGWSDAYVYEKRFQRVARYDDTAYNASLQKLGVWGQCNGDFHSGQQ